MVGIGKEDHPIYQGQVELESRLKGLKEASIEHSNRTDYMLSDNAKCPICNAIQTEKLQRYPKKAAYVENEDDRRYVVNQVHYGVSTRESVDSITHVFEQVNPPRAILPEEL